MKNIIIILSLLLSVNAVAQTNVQTSAKHTSDHAKTITVEEFANNINSYVLSDLVNADGDVVLKENEIESTDYDVMLLPTNTDVIVLNKKNIDQIKDKIDYYNNLFKEGGSAAIINLKLFDKSGKKHAGNSIWFRIQP